MNAHALTATQLRLTRPYARWCSLAKYTPGRLSAWDGCLLATFADPHSGDQRCAEQLTRVMHAWPVYLGEFRIDALNDLAVRADQLQTAGDPRGEWLAIWLMPPNEYRDRAVNGSAASLGDHVECLITEHERRARRTKTLPKECPWSIEPGSTLVIRVDGGPDQVVTFRALDFADMCQVFPLELAVTINEQINGVHAEHVDYTVSITSDAYNGKVEIIGGSAALALGLSGLVLHRLRYGL